MGLDESRYEKYSKNQLEIERSDLERKKSSIRDEMYIYNENSDRYAALSHNISKINKKINLIDKEQNRRSGY